MKLSSPLIDQANANGVLKCYLQLSVIRKDKVRWQYKVGKRMFDFDRRYLEDSILREWIDQELNGLLPESFL